MSEDYDAQLAAESQVIEDPRRCVGMFYWGEFDAEAFFMGSLDFSKIEIA